MGDYGGYGDGGGYGGYGDNNNGGGGGGGGGYGGYGDGGNANGGGYGGYGDNNGGGGGFMNDGGNAGGDGSPSKGGQRNKVDTLVPVTIRQLIEATEEPETGFSVDGRAVNKVCVVAKIMSVNAKSTSVDFQVEDSTGAFSAQKWLQENEKAPEFPVGSMVALFGSLRTFGGKRNLSCFAIRPVTDHNQMTHHFLDAILTHLQVTKGAANPELRNMVPGGNSSSSSSSAPKFDPYGAAQANPAAQPQPPMAGAPVGAGGNGDADLLTTVKRVFNEPVVEQLEEGFSAQQMLEELQRRGRKVSLQEVSHAIAMLTNEGHLYSTVDDDHFKSTGEV